MSLSRSDWDRCHWVPVWRWVRTQTRNSRHLCQDVLTRSQVDPRESFSTRGSRAELTSTRFIGPDTNSYPKHLSGSRLISTPNVTIP